jgi:NTP pyrophosphatase (non-canonical NTP hydrolase)
MKSQEYTINSAKTFKNREIGIDPRTTDLLHCAIGIVTEAGELCLAINIDHSVDKINILEEIGDVTWYSFNLARLIGWIPNEAYSVKYENFDINLAVDLLSVAASELMDHFKRAIYYHKGLDYEHIAKKLDEIHEILYSICVYHHIEFEKCLQANIDKLAKRYPGNFFTPDAAVNRDTDAERKELEK